MAAPPAGGEAGMLALLRYFWMVAKGHRLRPWKSPYLRWRMETFFGPPADNLDARKFVALLWSQRRQLGRFVRWAEERRKSQQRPR
jgi:hypothetical protein